MVKIMLPDKPISVNAMYRGRRFLTEAGKSIKATNAIEARRQYKGSPLSGKLMVSLGLVFEDKRKHDIDNCQKAIFDSLTGILWEDDDQIVELHVYKSVGPKSCATVTVEKI